MVELLSGLIFLSLAQALAEDGPWKVKKSKHFIVYYQQATDDYRSRVAQRAEHYYRSITDYLGLRRVDFWTWGQRCKIYLYPDRQAYLKSSESSSWSRGKVHVIKKEITTYVAREEFLDYVLPHEMGHIIFREAIGFEKRLPLCIDEAVAVLQEKDRQRYLRTAKKLVQQERFLPLDELFQILSGSRQFFFRLPWDATFHSHIFVEADLLKGGKAGCEVRMTISRQ